MSDVENKSSLSKACASGSVDLIKISQITMDDDTVSSYINDMPKKLRVEKMEIYEAKFTNDTMTKFFNGLRDKNIEVVSLSLGENNVDSDAYDAMFRYLLGNKSIKKITLSALNDENAGAMLHKAAKVAKFNSSLEEISIGLNHDIVDDDVAPYCEILASPYNGFKKLSFISNSVSKQMAIRLNKAKSLKEGRVRLKNQVDIINKPNIRAIANRVKSGR